VPTRPAAGTRSCSTDHGDPAATFRVGGDVFAVAPDGQRFLTFELTTAAVANQSRPLIVTVNWPALLNSTRER
jgi:hypothetical protein